MRLLDGDEPFETAASEFRLIDRYCDECRCPVAFCTLFDDIAAVVARSSDNDNNDDDNDNNDDDNDNNDDDDDSAGSGDEDDAWFATERSTTRTVGCPWHKKWYLCAACPDADFCEACSRHHEHPCVLGMLHQPEERCSNCQGGEYLAPLRGVDVSDLS